MTTPKIPPSDFDAALETKFRETERDRDVCKKFLEKVLGQPKPTHTHNQIKDLKRRFKKLEQQTDIRKRTLHYYRLTKKK